MQVIDHENGAEPVAQVGAQRVIRIAHVLWSGRRNALEHGPPGEIAAVAGYGADVLVNARRGLSEAEHVIDELDPELLVGAAIVGPGPGDRGRDRSVVLDAARPQLRREGVRGLGDPAQERVVVDCIGGASGQIQ